MLTFDESTHTYHLNGDRLPSVTQIIGDWIKVSGYYFNVFSGARVKAELFEAAGEFGTAVHNMVQYHIEGDLDITTLDPDFLAVLLQFEKWFDATNPEIIDTEAIGYSKRYKFAGKRDIKCIIKKQLHIVDIKTGAFDMAGPQLAAYVQIDKEMDSSRMTRYRDVLYLPKDGGDYKFVSFSDLNDFPFFLSRLTTYNYLRR